MPPAGQATSSLALWLHLRRRAALTQTPGAELVPPPGDGPLVLVHLSERSDDPPPVAALIKAMLSRRPLLRFAFLGAPAPEELLSATFRSVQVETPRDLATAQQMVATLAPRGLLLMGDQLPAALMMTMADQHRPIILSEARLTAYSRAGAWRGAINRGLMSRIDRILAPDLTAAAAARQLGARADRIELTGPVADTRPPLSANEAERAALAQILRGRHVWLAAAPTLPEAKAALAAHQSALHHNHRALLILAGLPEDMLPEINAEIEALGLAGISRSEDYDPEADDHVLIAEDPYEMGLWYRLTPVCFMGGTLIPGPGLEPRHPFEPAALGSAIIHGPIPGSFGAEWVQLDGATAARLVTGPEALTAAVADLSAPDQAALLAESAWAVSTGGAAVLRRIADTVIDTMEAAAA